MTKDAKYRLQLNNMLETETEIRVKLHWIYSKVNLLEDLREQLRVSIKVDSDELAKKKEQLKITQDPFMNLFIIRAEDEERKSPEKKKIFKNLNLEERVKVNEQEATLSRRIDDALAEQGYRTKDMWPQCTIALTLILLVLTCLVCFYKPDFVNLTVCVIAIYILENSTQEDSYHRKSTLPQMTLAERASSPNVDMFSGDIERKSPDRRRSVNYFESSQRDARNFRYLVLGIFVSLAHDILWFATVSSS